MKIHFVTSAKCTAGFPARYCRSQCIKQNFPVYVFLREQSVPHYSGCTTGSSDLDTVFENNLRRIGRMVAILDTWEQPVYLTRIWTVYEQFVASTLEIEARFMTLSRHLASEVSENND